MAPDKEENGSDFSLLAHGGLANLRNFRTNEEGRVVACDTVNFNAFELLPYMAKTAERALLIPPVYDNQGEQGPYIQHLAAFGKLSLAEAAKRVREAESMRVQILFVRAQDACRELFVSLAAWMVVLRDLRRWCERTPENDSKQIKYQLSMATLVFALDKEEVKRISRTECQLNDPTLDDIVANCLTKAQQEFNKLPKHVTTITKEVRKLATDFQKAVQDNAMASRDTARHVIQLQTDVEICMAESEQILARMKGHGTS